MGRFAPAVVAALGVATLLPTAHARENVTPVRVDYRAPPGCGQEASFVARVLARSSRIRRAAAGEAAPLLVVRMGRTGRAVHGHLVIQEVDGSQSLRDVDGETCESVENALVLVAALAIDPMAATASPPGGAGAEAGGPSSGTDASGAKPEKTEKTEKAEKAEKNDGKEGEAGTEDKSSGPTFERPRGPPLDTRRGLHLAVGAGALVESGAAPDMMLGVPVFLDLGYTRLSRRSRFSEKPRFRPEDADGASEVSDSRIHR